MKLHNPISAIKNWITQQTHHIIQSGTALFLRKYYHTSTTQNKTHKTTDTPPKIQNTPLLNRTLIQQASTASPKTRTEEIESFYKQSTPYENFETLIRDEVSTRNQGKSTFLDQYLNRQNNPKVDILIDSYLAEKHIKTLNDQDRSKINDNLYDRSILDVFNLESFKTLSDSKFSRDAFKHALRLIGELYQVPIEKRRDFLIEKNILETLLSIPQTHNLFRIALSSLPQKEWPSLLLYQNFNSNHTLLHTAANTTPLPAGFLKALFQSCTQDPAAKDILKKLLELPILRNENHIPPLIFTLIQNHASDVLDFLSATLPITKEEWQQMLMTDKGYTLISTALENNEVSFAYDLIEKLTTLPREQYYLLQKTDQAQNNIFHHIAKNTFNDTSNNVLNNFYQSITDIFSQQPISLKDLLIQRNAEGYNPLLLAIKSQNQSLLFFLKQTLDTNSIHDLLVESSHNGDNVYHLLAQTGNSQTLQWINKYLSEDDKANLMLAKNHNQQDPLHITFIKPSGAMKGGNPQFRNILWNTLSINLQNEIVEKTSLQSDKRNMKAFLLRLNKPIPTIKPTPSPDLD